MRVPPNAEKALLPAPADVKVRRPVKKRLDAGQTVKFTFRVNDHDGPGYELAANQSVSETNGRTFLRGWVRHGTNELHSGQGM